MQETIVAFVVFLLLDFAYFFIIVYIYVVIEIDNVSIDDLCKYKNLKTNLKVEVNKIEILLPL